jgi:hypothetical protein
MSPRDLPQHAGALSRSTRGLLERGRVGEPLPPVRRARLKAGVLAELAGMSALATTTWWTSAAAKVIGSIALVGAVGATGVGVWTVSGGRADDRHAIATAPRIATSTAPWVGTTAAVPAAPVPVVEPRAATSMPIASPASTTPATLPAPPTTPRAPAPAAPNLDPTPLIAAPSVAAVPVDSPAAATSAPVASTPVERSPVPRAARLEEEARLLRDADDALKGGDAARALALLEQHATLYPRSALEPERGAERIFALCQLGRTDEARREAAEFLRTHERGPLSTRVQSSCGGAR